ncbi:histidinol dehydrogenase [Amphibacillus marinus]|uniref:Histidinol dehydrogenase n=1 Tax=Amphibacillus marinus TaxID=872970 RepID=A0A1H8GXD3_9BACI|nr:histidinol dehydrogenase [Amphibacillus marinus]SEN47908.1 histidinol dehydrogenase [Amphibacillus marinus]
MKIAVYQAQQFKNQFLNKRKSRSQANHVTQVAQEVIDAVYNQGEKALRSYIKQFDGSVPNELLVSDQERERAWQQVSERTVQALQNAAENIRTFHNKQLNQSKFMQHDEQIVSGQLFQPIDRVGIYVPGGTACYPSSVLMNAIPAKIAGVAEIIMVTPARDGQEIAPILSVAADIAGVTRIYKVGGIQAIAALTYGTESIPVVDKIVGPGNAYVAAAKALVYGDVGIDMIAGPSEVAIIADDSANPKHVAADLIAQAEHDVQARTVLFTPSAQLIAATKAELATQLETLPRTSIASEAILTNGALVQVSDLTEAFDLANMLAPEHLEIQLDHALSYLSHVKHAGSVFLGHYTPESLGDYYAGPNHVLPTSGTAKFSSGLSVDDFMKKTTFLYYSQQALATAAKDIVTLAEEEQLSGHARAVTKRLEVKKNDPSG